MTNLTGRLTQFLAKRNHSHFIDGEFKTGIGDETIPVINPANEEEIGRAALGSKEDVNQAVASAKKAFHHNSPWRKMSPDDRGKILFNFDRNRLRRMCLCGSGRPSI